MSTIDLKLKTYEQLQFEITKLNTDIFLKDKEIERLNNIIKEVREYINHYETIRGYYEYQELGYDEYNYEDDLKKELLEILDKGE